VQYAAEGTKKGKKKTRAIKKKEKAAYPGRKRSRRMEREKKGESIEKRKKFLTEGVAIRIQAGEKKGENGARRKYEAHLFICFKGKKGKDLTSYCQKRSPCQPGKGGDVKNLSKGGGGGGSQPYAPGEGSSKKKGSLINFEGKGM